MIRGFKDRTTEDIYHNIDSRYSREVPKMIWKAIVKKLDMIDAAISLTDLAALPGNRLESLKGNLKGFYSIRVNDQYRIVFKWVSGIVLSVQVIDYH